MAFIVKISVIFFLLSIVLLSCSSHAHDHLPQVRLGDRKLLALPGLSKFIKRLFKQEATAIGTTPPDLKVRLIKELTYKGELAMQGIMRKMGGDIAEKLFRHNGKKGLRVGWKAGKWYYKVENKCEEFEQLLALGDTCANIPGPSCVLSFAFNTTKLSCEQVLTAGTSDSIPCTYIRGTYYPKKGKKGIFLTATPVTDCAF